MSDHIEHECRNCGSLTCNGVTCYRRLEAAVADAWREYDKMADTARSLGADLGEQQAVSRTLSGVLERVGRVDRMSALKAERDGYRMALEIVWEAITPTMVEEQCANFIAGYVRTALDNPTSAVLRETHADLVKGRALSIAPATPPDAPHGAPGPSPHLQGQARPRKRP